MKGDKGDAENVIPQNALALYAPLVDSPYKLSWKEIAELTDRQIVEVYYRPRDKEGNPIEMPAEHDRAELTPDQQLERERLQYFAIGATVGVPHDKLVEAWNKKVESKHGGQYRT